MSEETFLQDAGMFHNTWQKTFQKHTGDTQYTTEDQGDRRPSSDIRRRNKKGRKGDITSFPIWTHRPTEFYILTNLKLVIS